MLDHVFIIKRNLETDIVPTIVPTVFVAIVIAMVIAVIVIAVRRFAWLGNHGCDHYDGKEELQFLPPYCRNPQVSLNLAQWYWTSQTGSFFFALTA